MVPTHPDPRDPADISRRVMPSREQRDWINAAAAALEDHAGHDEDPPAMLEAAAELRRVAGEWDIARDSRPEDAGDEHLREALRQIADAESGIWGWIARGALDGRPATSNGDGGARRDGALTTRDAAIATRPQGARERR
jgi:hypothetical protein